MHTVKGSKGLHVKRACWRDVICVACMILPPRLRWSQATTFFDAGSEGSELTSQVVTGHADHLQMLQRG